MNEQETKPAPLPPVPLIYARIAACLADIKAVGKNRRNQQQGYDFRSIDDFFDNCQPVLATHKVFITPTILEYKREERTTKSGGIIMTTLAHVRFKVCTEDGSFIEADAIGEGSDSGDKSANKCASQALKYLFMQVFCVRVQGEANDTENDSPAYTPKAPQQAAGRPPLRQTPMPPKTAPQANVERTAATPASVLPAQATPKTLEWAWNLLTQEFGPDATWSFLVGKSWVNAESNDYTTWELQHVPASKQALAALADEIRKSTQVAGNQGENPGVVTNCLHSDLPLPPEWADVVFTICPKGVKRADYFANPKTLGQLYMGDAEDKKRLFTFAKNWQPEPWVGSDGKKRPVSQEDFDCRMALDLMMEWRSQRGETAE